MKKILIVCLAMSSITVVSCVNNNNTSNGNYNTEYANMTDEQDNYSYGKSNAYIFNSHQSVLPYLESRTFYNSDKNVTVTFRNGCIYANGECLSYHIKVVEAAGTQAVITANSPYGSKISFLVDTESNCIADNNDVYFEK